MCLVVIPGFFSMASCEIFLSAIFYYYLIILTTKIVSCCRRTLQSEGHSAAGWGIGGSVWLQTVGSKARSFGQWAAATCAAPPIVIASQYATSNCKPLLVIKCKWWYTNAETFNLVTVFPLEIMYFG